jgi:hypothetical protein
MLAVAADLERERRKRKEKKEEKVYILLAGGMPLVLVAGNFAGS